MCERERRTTMTTPLNCFPFSLLSLSLSLPLSFSFSLYSPAGRGVMSVAADMTMTQSLSVLWLVCLSACKQREGGREVVIFLKGPLVSFPIDLAEWLVHGGLAL